MDYPKETCDEAIKDTKPPAVDHTNSFDDFDKEDDEKDDDDFDEDDIPSDDQDMHSNDNDKGDGGGEKNEEEQKQPPAKRAKLSSSQNKVSGNSRKETSSTDGQDQQCMETERQRQISEREQRHHAYERKKYAYERKKRLKENSKAVKKQTCTDDDGNDWEEWDPDPPQGMDKKQWREYLVKKSYKSCEVTSVEFCDKDRVNKESFNPNDEIYVKVTFKNNSTLPAYLSCGRGTFRRSGIKLALDGVAHRYIGSSSAFMPGVFIHPNKEYTFFRLLSKPAKKGIGNIGALIATPSENNTYYVNVSKEGFSFPSKTKFWFVIAK